MAQFICESSTIPPYQCRKCNFCTLFLRNLKHHSASNGQSEESEIVTPNYTCSKNCNLKSYSKLLMGLHQNKCFPKNWLKCDKSNYRAERKETLQIHIQNKHHRRKWNELKNCKILKNLSGSKCFQCDICSYKTRWKSNFEKHNIHNHTDENEIEWFICDQCNYKTKRKDALNRHILQKHTSDEKINWLKCDHCTFKFKTRGNLKSHIFYQHTNLNETDWFKCDHCPYRAKLKSNLKKHNKAHLFKNFQCAKCSIKFENNEKLKDHLLEHGQMFKCDLCPLKTRWKSNLKQHYINKHIQDKHSEDEEINWFQCDHCQYKTKKKNYLNRHMSKVHSVQYLQ